MLDFSPIQVLLVLAVALLVLGPKRLPELGRNLGSGIRDFKKAVTDDGVPHGDGTTDDDDGTEVTAERLMAQAAAASTDEPRTAPHSPDGQG